MTSSRIEGRASRRLKICAPSNRSAPEPVPGHRDNSAACGKAVGKFRDLRLALQQLLDGGGVFVVAVDVVVSYLRNEVRERFRCRRLLTKNGHDLVLLFLRPLH